MHLALRGQDAQEIKAMRVRRGSKPPVIPGGRSSSKAALSALLQLVGASHDGAFAVDSQQRVVYWSASAERITGYKASDAVGQLCYEVIQGGDYDGHPICRHDCPTITAARRGRRVPAFDIKSRCKKGTNIWLNVTIIPVSRRVAGAPMAVHIFRDVTARRQVELLGQETVNIVRSFLEHTPANGEAARRPSPPPTPGLTPRELEVLDSLARGASTDKLAADLGISVSTARNHLDRLMRKFGAHSRLELVIRARQTGMA